MTPKPPLKVLIVITGLQVGGAETMLCQLLARWSKAVAPLVVSLTEDGPIGEQIRRQGKRVEALDMRSSGVVSGLARLYRLCREERPDVVFSWLYHADLLGSLVARAAGCRRIVWNIRNTVIPRRAAPWNVHVTARLCAMLSWCLPQRILCCSARAAEAHVGIGYRRALIEVIPNGFDFDRFRPEAGAKAALCRELGLPERCLVVGRVARFDPQKDHVSFLTAAARLHTLLPDTRFVLVGKGVDAGNPALADLVRRLGLADVVYLLGYRNDVPRLIAGFDVMISSSIAEAFPNVLGEAMAVGVPCVATDVGDSARLLGDCGTVVPPGDPEKLAEACREILSLDLASRAALGQSARERIARHYNLAEIARQYEAFLLDTATGKI